MDLGFGRHDQMQAGNANQNASYQLPESGLDHAVPMPSAPAPDLLVSEIELTRRNAERTPEPWRTMWLSRDRPIEYRPVDPQDPFKPGVQPPHAQDWCRLAFPMPDIDAHLARVLFAYASD
ncbi:MAG: hypothetical protein NWP84_09440, partial [Cyanobium sp. MAG_04]|nr:hypothetical protein [Cyanobium sp. MAG_04]